MIDNAIGLVQGVYVLHRKLRKPVVRILIRIVETHAKSHENMRSA